MSAIASSAERSSYHHKERSSLKDTKDITQATCKAAYEAAECLKAKCIVVCSSSGRTAKMIAKYRPDIPIIALVASENGCRQCSLYYDVYPLKVERKQSPDEVVELGKAKAEELTMTIPGDVVVLVAGTNFSYGHTDSIQIYQIQR